jgi:hypothetical protein
LTSPIMSKRLWREMMVLQFFRGGGGTSKRRCYSQAGPLPEPPTQSTSLAIGTQAPS